MELIDREQWIIAHLSSKNDLPVEMISSDFTLYFLAYDHSGEALPLEEKKASRFQREGKHRKIRRQTQARSH